MLVLTRKLGEQITIGGNTVVSILAINGGRVRVGVTAPREVGIVRSELAPFGTDTWRLISDGPSVVSEEPSLQPPRGVSRG